MSLTSCASQNLKTFHMYNNQILEALKLRTSNGYTATDKATDIFLLAKGWSLEKSQTEDSYAFERYESLFKKLFGSDYKNVMYLHKLSTMSESNVVEMFNYNQLEGNAKENKLEALYDILVKHFMKGDLRLDNDSVKWLSNLLKICINDSSGVNYLLKVHNIQMSKNKIYNSLLSQDNKKLAPFFSEIKSVIDEKYSIKISEALRGNLESLCSLLMCQVGAKRINKQKTEENKSRDILQAKSDCDEVTLAKTMKALSIIINDSSLKIDQYDEHLQRLNIDTNIKHLLYGFQGVMEDDSSDALIIFDHQYFEEALGDCK